MKVVTAHTMQEIDRQAIAEYGIPGLQLMENAGRSCVEEIIAEFGATGRCVVMAGKGNNGGDGYVIARLLGQKGWSVKVIILADREQITGDAAVNLEKLPASDIDYLYPRRTIVCPAQGRYVSGRRDCRRSARHRSAQRCQRHLS